MYTTSKMLAAILYVAVFFWTFNQSSSVPSRLLKSIQDVLKPNYNITDADYRLETLFKDDDFNGLSNKRVIIEVTINEKVFTIDNENSDAWDTVNQLVNYEIHKCNDNVLFSTERIAESPSTDIIRLIATNAQRRVINT